MNSKFIVRYTLIKMEDKDKTKKQLLEKIKLLEQRVPNIEETGSSCQRVEGLLEESDEKYCLLIQTIPDIIYEISHDGKFIFISDAIKQFGYTSQELIGKHFKEILHPEDFQEVNRVSVLPRYKGKITGDAGAPKVFDEKRTGERMTKNLEVRIALKKEEGAGEEYFYGEVHSAGRWSKPVGEKEKEFMGSIGIIRNITQRKLAEEELTRAYQELKEKEAQLIQSEKMAGIGQLAAGIAHEINNPLSYVITNISFIKSHLGDFWEAMVELEKLFEDISLQRKEWPQDFKQRWQDIKKKMDWETLKKELPDVINDSLEGSARIKKIVGGLLSFSRASKEQFEYADINEEIENALLIVRNELKYKCELVEDLKPLPRIFCNPGQIGQVFVNLFINAAQAIEEKGEISIKTYLKDNYVYIEVSDTGRGIPPEYLGKIFEPFFTTKKEGKGTGLGLSIVYAIIKKHRGTIDVVSRLYEGTTFTIKLPQNMPDNESAVEEG